MNRTRMASAVDAQAESFDTLARTFTRRFQRRQVFRLLAATVATGVFGTAVATDADGKRRRKPKPKPKPKPRPEPPQDPTPAVCLAEGNQCGTTAGQQGHCRRAAPADNQAGFICTSIQAGNTCTASTQCGAGTRCMMGVVPAGQVAALNCRVVIA